MLDTRSHIESSGFTVNGFYVRPFQLNPGEIVVIQLFGGSHHHDLKMRLVDIFSGRVQNENVTVKQPLRFVDHFREHGFRRWLWPTTVGEYLRRNADVSDPLSTKIFDYAFITKKTKVNSLVGNPRRLLAISAMLTIANDIIFDLVGADPQGASAIYELVKGKVKEGGSAILLDWVDDMKNDCTRFIAVERVSGIPHS